MRVDDTALEGLDGIGFGGKGCAADAARAFLERFERWSIRDMADGGELERSWPFIFPEALEGGEALIDCERSSVGVRHKNKNKNIIYKIKYNII